MPPLYLATARAHTDEEVQPSGTDRTRVNKLLETTPRFDRRSRPGLYTHPRRKVFARRRDHRARGSKRRRDGQRGPDAPGEGPGGAAWGAHRRSDGGRSGNRGWPATHGTQGWSPRRRGRRRDASRRGTRAGKGAGRRARQTFGRDPWAPRARLTGRTSENCVTAKFAALTFHALP